VNALILFLSVLILVDIWATVIYARRAEAAARDASEMSQQIMQGLLQQADQEPLTRRRHL
jgi:hypothetical protein